MSIVTSFASTIINPEPTKAEIEVEGDQSYKLQFNPSALSLRRGRNWSDEGQFESGQPALKFTGGSSDVLTFKVVIDHTEPRANNALEEAAFALAALNPLFFGGALGPSSDRNILEAGTGLTDPSDVADNLAAWLKMTEVLDVTGAGGTADAYRRPPTVVMKWGSSFVFSGVVTNLGIEITVFDSDGNPRRAEVNVSMKGRAMAELEADEIIFPDEPSAS